MWELEKRIYFEECHAELVLRIGDDLDEGRHMSVILKLMLFVPIDILEFKVGVLVMTADFAQQILLLGLLVLEISESLVDAFLKHVELIYQLLVFPIKFRTGAHTHI